MRPRAAAGAQGPNRTGSIFRPLRGCFLTEPVVGPDCGPNTAHNRQQEMAAANLYIATQGRVAADATAILPSPDGTVEISGPAGVTREPLARSAAVVRLDSAFLTAPADVIGRVPAVENIRTTCASKLGPGFFDKAGPRFYPQSRMSLTAPSNCLSK